MLGAAFGALFALDLNDRLGRLNAWRLAVLVWASGTFIQVFASGIYGLLLFARIWSGLGAGLLTVVVPLYLSEIAPTRTRGLVVSCYMVILLLILTVGFFINYGAKIHMPPTRTQYRLVQAIPLIPVGFAFAASFFVPESPRYLISQQRPEEGRAVLARLRAKSPDDPTIEHEFTTIDTQIRSKAADLSPSSSSSLSSHWEAFKETQCNKNYRHRFWLLMTMQTVA